VGNPGDSSDSLRESLGEVEVAISHFLNADPNEDFLWTQPSTIKRALTRLSVSGRLKQPTDADHKNPAFAASRLQQVLLDALALQQYKRDVITRYTTVSRAFETISAHHAQLVERVEVYGTYIANVLSNMEQPTAPASR
jgi:hypothetical protein